MREFQPGLWWWEAESTHGAPTDRASLERALS